MKHLSLKEIEKIENSLKVKAKNPNKNPNKKKNIFNEELLSLVVKSYLKEKFGK